MVKNTVCKLNAGSSALISDPLLVLGGAAGGGYAQVIPMEEVWAKAILSMFLQPQVHLFIHGSITFIYLFSLYF